MTKLVIVESPAKAKTVAKYIKGLGSFEVIASVGHIRDLPKSNKDAIDIENDFKPRYVVSPGKEKIVSDMKARAALADEVLLATDPDREGEAIAWHIKEALGLKKPKRVVFNEITEEAVKLAIQNPRLIDKNLREAQEARRVLDRLFGYDLSGLIWKKVRYGLSAGRVQSPALRIVMEREREIRAFNSETYWVIEADTYTNKKSEAFTLTCKDEPRDEKVVKDILHKGKTEDWFVKDLKETAVSRAPKAPFITSTLQQTASTRLGFSPSRTMATAQKLYQGGHITYMRTDSTALSQNALSQIKKTVTSLYGADHYKARTYGKTSKNAQEAHEAIRPSKISAKEVGKTGDEKALYNLIWARTVASQMKDASLIRTRLVANVTSGNIPDFTTSGQRVVSPGWLKADPAARSEDTEVPKVTKGDALKLAEIRDIEKETQPPHRYTEAGLIKELEKRGIGRPSTFASTIKTIEDRGYVTKEGRTLIPTDTGDVVSSFIEEHFTDYISDTFTAQMEDELDEIAGGNDSYIQTLKDFYTPFHKAVVAKEDIPKLTTLGKADKQFKCPTCKASMDIKLGRGGKFLSCSTYPECEGALTLEGKELGAKDSIGDHPESGLPIYVMEGRFGPYVQLGGDDDEETPEEKDAKQADDKKAATASKDSKTKKGTKEKPAKKPKRAKKKKKPTPRRASIPADIKPEEITLDQAVHLLILPRELGLHPDSGLPIIANIGRFGPYIGHDGEFRSLKEDSPYKVSLKKALEILAQPKAPPRGAKIVKDIGKHPKTGKMITLYESKSGKFFKKGLRRIYLPDTMKVEKLTPEEVVALLKAS